MPNNLKVLAAIFLLIFMQGCATDTASHPMQTCDDRKLPDGIDSTVANRALNEAAKWNIEDGYGPDCLVCANFFSDNENEFSIQVTSPIDSLINTDALLTFKKSDGTLIKAAKFHSCHARIIRR